MSTHICSQEGNGNAATDTSCATPTCRRSTGHSVTGSRSPLPPARWSTSRESGRFGKGSSSRIPVVLRDARGPIARVDFLWERYGVLGGADGLGKYQSDGWLSTREIVRAEKRREERILDAGYEIVRWGWQEANNPPVLAHRLRAAFARGLERRRGKLAA